MRQILKILRSEIRHTTDLDSISLIEILAGLMSGVKKIPSGKGNYKKSDANRIIKAFEHAGIFKPILESGPEILGYIYEFLQEPGPGNEKINDKQTDRRKGGVFYTPSYITAFLVNSALDSIKREHRQVPPRMYDPACGGGAFLIAAFRELLKRYPGSFSGEEKTPLVFIHGTDLDPDAVHVAKLALWLESGCAKTAWKILNKNIRVGDSLRQIAIDNHIQYEIVAANPPYRNVKRGIDPETIEFCMENYRSVKGQWDLSVPFIELALDHLLLPGGAMAYILPNPVLLAENYQPVREIILENDLAMFGPAGKPFDDPGVEASLLVVRRGKPSKLKTYILDGRFGKIKKSGRISKDIILKLPFKIFSHLADDSLTPVFNSLESGKLNRLGDLVKFTRGIECGKRDKRIFKNSTEMTLGFPLIAGESLKPYFVEAAYRFSAPSDRLGYKDLKAGGLWSGKHQLLLRRVADKPISAVANPPALVLNTIYVVQALDSVDLDPWSASALFNSSFFRDLFRKIYAFDDKLFPYLRISQLSQIPVPRSALTDRDLSNWSKTVHGIMAGESVTVDFGEKGVLIKLIDERVENYLLRECSFIL